MYTSLSLCLLRATCASDVAMICIEVWHKKQNSSSQGGAAAAAPAANLDVGQSYAPPVFMTHMRGSGLGPSGVGRSAGGRRPLPTYIYAHTEPYPSHTYSCICEWISEQTNNEICGSQAAGRANGTCFGVGFVVAERFALFIVVADRSQNIIEICQTARF